MKKLLSVVLALSMMISAAAFFCSTTSAENITHGYVLGDADDDGNLSMKDVILIRRYLNILADVKDISLLAADADINENVDMKDVILIRKFMLSLEEASENNVDEKYKVDTVTIAKRNISRYTIVISDDSNECMKYSASQLSRFVNRACGIALNVTNDEASVEGYKIKYVFDTDNTYSLGKEGYSINVSSDGDVTVYCGSLRGPWYATVYLLEEFIGYRFLPTHPGCIEYLYRAENVDLPAGFNETEVPVLEYRATAQRGVNSDNFAFFRDNAVDASHKGVNLSYGGGVGTLWFHAHSYAYQMGGIENFVWPDDSAEVRDEKNKIIDNLHKTQPCLTDEETYNKIVEYNKFLLDTRESWGAVFGVDYTQISCSPNDNANFCMCSRCKSVYFEEGSIAGTVFRLSNRVAEELEKDRPELGIYTIAYWDARYPPKITRPHENVYVCFCFAGCNNHTYDDVESCVECGGNPRLRYKTLSGEMGNNVSNEEDVACFKKWAELTDKLMVWYYGSNFIYYMAPSPNLFNIYNDFRYLVSNGAIGIYSEGPSAPYYSFEYLRGYVVSKMLWDPFMSEEEYNGYLNEYLMIYYGDGWRYIREYIEMSNHASDLKGCWTNNFDRPFEMYDETYFRDNYKTMSELFDRAYAAAGTDDQRSRITMCRLHCDWLGLSATYERDYVNGDSASRAEYAEKYRWLYDYITKNNIRITTVDYPGNSIGCDNLPKDNTEIVKPVSWLWENATGYFKDAE